MRTLIAGIFTLRRAPMAIVPLASEGVVAAALVVAGVFPASGASAAATAIFPLDVFFDLKQSLAMAPSHLTFVALIGASILVRGTALAVTLWLADESRGPLLHALRRGVSLSSIALLTLFPSAVFLYAGTAIRYAPFIWVGAVLGLFPALYLARRAVRLEDGTLRPRGSNLPEGLPYLGYTSLIALTAAAMSSLGHLSPLGAAAVLVCVGPLHGLFLLGWREHTIAGTYPGGGALSTGIAVIVIGALLAGTIYDRYIYNPPPVGRVSAEGKLFLLGGVDSTLDEGALAELDVRQVGFSAEDSETLSYVGAEGRHRKLDTHEDLGDIATAVADQIEETDPPRFLLGHSQAGLIVDRVLDRGLAAPDRSALLAPSPVFPPTLEIPGPGRDGEGVVGGNVARGLAWLLRNVGAVTFDVDAPAAPVHLDPVVVIEARVPRLSVWALGDSVWLDRDWRRPGEVNAVAITDHVGVTNNRRSLQTVRRFFAGEPVQDDESSWRGAAVVLLRYAFEPWRPQ